MLIETNKKRRKLFFEILMLVALCFVLSMFLFFFISTFGRAILEEYCFNNDIVLDEFEWLHLQNTLFGVGFCVSAVFFIILFFILFGERLAYIRQIIDGVHALRRGELSYRVKLQGNNELTELAEAVNFFSESEQKIKEKEKKLKEEKEILIRTLSHDIRTPLTSIMSYTELLSAKEALTDEEQRKYLLLVSQKTAQIKELTDILLDGGRRETQHFEDARLLLEQLTDEFEGALEDHFKLETVLFFDSAFSGNFDVGELRRIFDNLISNIQKYAEPSEAVKLSISKTDSGIVIWQSNGIRKDKTSTESYKMGLNSIRRIVQNYSGTVEISEIIGKFEIKIILSNI